MMEALGAAFTATGLAAAVVLVLTGAAWAIVLVVYLLLWAITGERPIT